MPFLNMLYADRDSKTTFLIVRTNWTALNKQTLFNAIEELLRDMPF
jgi:hypothetical protein